MAQFRLGGPGLPDAHNGLLTHYFSFDTGCNMQLASWLFLIGTDNINVLYHIASASFSLCHFTLILILQVFVLVGHTVHHLSAIPSKTLLCEPFII